MLFSLALIFLSGLFMKQIFQKLNLPPLIGMLFMGILIGPHLFNLIDSSILEVSAELRKIALIIILMRAGLSLDIHDLKRVGRPAVMLCFVPALFEILGIAIFAPLLLNVSMNGALLMGAVLAAVSPAVIVPKMIQVMDQGYGTKKGIPQMILAGASMDDIVVIVLFSAFLVLNQGGSVTVASLLEIPLSIITGIVAGIITGYLLNKILQFVKLNGTSQIVIYLSIGFLLSVWADISLFPFSGLLAIMVSGMMFYKQNQKQALVLKEKLGDLWMVAEILLFVLVGASVSLTSIKDAGIMTILLLLISLSFRSVGVFVCMIKTNLNQKEKLFCVLSYLPKATVQAAIGGIALANGIAEGNLILTVSVLSIILTAPLGSIAIEKTYKKFLVKD